ncbi:uncharacterized protein LOC114945361 isoform X2 [Nylanderia fulva]|uniref:uncharacterized protein LOC114945361 isoform X2 n=1 Tax=Nylanderia fulva TaxID=613905 RepID=UPI0010FAD189|nr:uncharacterized protein LOC114945361 isoform X2 [Nylanderia fulva]
MEKKGLRKKDILRMDGLLPPTRRLPVCDAVSSASDKKKEKKWSIGGILRRISSIKDYDSSSNDEEIVYCNRKPRKPTKLKRQPDDVVLHTLENHLKQKMTVDSNVRHSAESHRDSLHSRSSDGSLDGLGKKTRRNKLKARAEAKRDHLCVESSSDEDSRRSNNSLNKIHGVDGAQNGQRNSICSRRTRAARTERYIKRLSRDEGNNGTSDTSNDLYSKRCSSEYAEDKQRAAYVDANGLCRPPIHPRRFAGMYPNSNRTLQSVQRSSAESLRDANHAGLPSPEEIFVGDYRRYSTGQYVTDLNQNNAYGKISRHTSGEAGNFFTYPAKNACHYSEPFDPYVIDPRSIDPDSHQPPVPPPRDPRYRIFGYGYSSYPTNRHHNVPNSFKQEDKTNVIAREISRPDWRNFGSNNELVQRDKVEREMENPRNSQTELRNSLECINNKYNCGRHRADESIYEESEAMRCRRRNTRNDQLNCNDANYGALYKAKNKSANICESNKHETISSHVSAASSGRSLYEQRISRSITPPNVDNRAEKSQRTEDNRGTTPNEEELENKRRSSRNLEEALSELEAIYNSLRLGDEDLLDRAERRSMEEFSLKQGKSDAVIAIAPDSPDRTKDDMAYRRMHPKERPTSLSDIAGQSTLSNISYLVASPVLSRRDSADDLVRLPSIYPSRRDEPDVTRDDVVFRSINHANNTLRVIDPQPPFGIPLGPVTAATESDYLHTTPTKPEQPRSPYIPQCEPDVVTDDLAYRALRKDVAPATSRNIVAENSLDVAKEQQRPGIRKKRAVRSLSANLYGLINHDRIHLRREPSLDAIKDEPSRMQQNVAANNLAATYERPEYLRRVVSDGELSDNDAVRRREEPITTDETDINGNHPAVGAYRKKLCDYVSQASPKKEKGPNIADAMLSSKTILDDKFWHDYLRSDSNAPMPENSPGSTETVFTAYSRLCQDLVNLIKDEDGDVTLPNDSTVSPAFDKSKVDDFGIDEPSTSIPTRTVSSHYSGRANDEQSPTAFSSSLTNSSRPTSESTPATSNLDFYLCAVDENVGLIAAEALDSSTDRLRDSRLSPRENSWTSRGSEVEYQSGSTRSSALYSQDEPSDDRLVLSTSKTTTRAPSKPNSSTSDDGGEDQSSCPFDSVSTADAEFSKAVRDLELAAASLCEHGREIEDLGKARRRGKKIRARDDEDGSIRKISPSPDVLRQERERDQEEITVVPASGIETTRSEARAGDDEGRQGARTLAMIPDRISNVTCSLEPDGRR